MPVTGEGMIGRGLTLIPGRKSGTTGSPGPLSGDDQAYARALAGSEPAAVREFTTRNLPVVLGIARRLLGDEAEAEDAAQDVFVKVWKNAHRWQPGRARFGTWIGRIAINACFDRLRKRRERPAAQVPDRPDGAPGAEARLQAGHSAVRIRSAVANLPERQRLALELCHFQEHSNIDAAAMMQVSVEALESLLSRARRALKAELSSEAGGLMNDLAAARTQEEG